MSRFSCSGAWRTPLLLVILLAAGCSVLEPKDGPGKAIAPESIAEATPRLEPITRAGNYTPYTVFGETYHLLPSAEGYQSRGIASWYGRKFHGRLTSNGERYDMYGMTAAHKTLPIPSYVRVTNTDNGNSAIVRINDRGPFHPDREIDLSWAAAIKLGFNDKGTAPVEITAIDPVAWLAEQQKQPTPAVATSQPQPDLLDGDYLQAGSFQQPDLAHLQLLELIDKIPYAIQVHPSAGHYKVLIGPLVNAERVAQARSMLAKAGFSAFKFAAEQSCALSNNSAKC